MWRLNPVTVGYATNTVTYDNVCVSEYGQPTCAIISKAKKQRQSITSHEQSMQIDFTVCTPPDNIGVKNTPGTLI